jgi:hypothetical protein
MNSFDFRLLILDSLQAEINNKYLINLGVHQLKYVSSYKHLICQFN